MIESLPAGQYEIGLMGAYTLAAGDTVNTFTDGARHFYTLTIPERPAINLPELSPDAVHCKNGTDGGINLSVSGGNGNYTAFLLNTANDTLQRKSVTAGNHAFDELYQGSYSVYIRDGNGCDYDVAGNPAKKSAVVTEPADSVFIFIAFFLNFFDLYIKYCKSMY